MSSVNAPEKSVRSPTFSVVMPAHHAEAAIERLIAKTPDDFELILVNDGSIDDTAARVERYLCDTRPHLIAQAQPGQAEAGLRRVRHLHAGTPTEIRGAFPDLRSR